MNYIIPQGDIGRIEGYVKETHTPDICLCGGNCHGIVIEIECAVSVNIRYPAISTIVDHC